MEYNFELIGNRIRDLRNSKGWNQDRLVEEIRQYCGFSRNTLSKIENGNSESFTLDFLLSCCKIFHCDMGYLLGEFDMCKTRDNQYIHEITGLSEYAIIQLAELNSDDYGDGRKRLQLINWLMQDPRFTVSLIGSIIRYCDRYLDFEHSKQISAEELSRLADIAHGDHALELNLLMHGLFTPTISDEDISKKNDLKDSAYMQAQRALDSVLSCLVYHHCKKEGL